MPPLTMMVKPVSGLCNMRCTYCFYADEMARRSVDVYERMSDETLENLVRRAFTYADGRVLLAFQGGEPTLAGAAFYRTLLRLEKKYNARHLPVQHAIQTNGLALDDELLDVLSEGHFLVGVSLDGCREIHDARRIDAGGNGTYDRALEATRRLRKKGIEYNILCVVDEAIGRRPDEVFQALKEHEYLQFIPCLDPLDGTQSEGSLSPETYGQFLIRMFDLYDKTLRSGRFISIRLFDDWVSMLAGYPPEECGFLGRCTPHFLVESNGNVYPCDFYALDEWKLGNVNEQSLFRIEGSPVGKSFCQTADSIDPQCLSCKWRSLCRYGCRRDREPLHPGQPSLSRWCQSYQMFFEARSEAFQNLVRQLAHR
ncbi:MAG: radical SAM protein [Eubacteriales bacterium]|nr:radical SAM protein [Eubacteriales bacterium]